MSADVFVRWVQQQVDLPGLDLIALQQVLAQPRGRLLADTVVAGDRTPVRIPWGAGDLVSPKGQPVTRFDEDKARESGVRWFRDRGDIPTDFDPPEDFDAYDLIAVQVSGGKDSVACLAALHRLIGHRPDLWSKVELWHQDVDGAAEPFMDWPVTRAYVQGLAQLYARPVRFSFREGGFYQELFRAPGEARGAKWLETEQGLLSIGKPPGPNALGRRRFPALTADLRVRWCTGDLKIDVARAAFGHAAKEGLRAILTITGERAAESSPRARYHRGQDTEMSSGRRQIHQLRLVYDHSDAEVWDELRLAFPGKGYGIQPHPAYELGWSRCSCAGCIFSSGEDLARLREALPRQFARLAGAEQMIVAETEARHPELVVERARLRTELAEQAQEPATRERRARGKLIRTRLAEISNTLGRTVVAGKTVLDRANSVVATLPPAFDRWRAYADGSEPWTLDHMLRGPGAPVFADPWALPPGAVNGHSSGPPT
jgi:3'-phosphoadenosine 5'-phosphosulfate sulfotransferase (PAPS reductase)/FAD synthetase